MSATESKGVYQLPNGMWGYRYAYMLNGKQVILMEPKDYTVIKIEGEYAYLREDGETEDKAIFIAMALLPPRR